MALKTQNNKLHIYFASAKNRVLIKFVFFMIMAYFTSISEAKQAYRCDDKDLSSKIFYGSGSKLISKCITGCNKKQLSWKLLGVKRKLKTPENFCDTVFWNTTMCFNCWQRKKYVSDGLSYQKISVGPEDIADVCKISNPCSSQEKCVSRKTKQQLSYVSYRSYKDVGKVCFPKNEQYFRCDDKDLSSKIFYANESKFISKCITECNRKQLYLKVPAFFLEKKTKENFCDTVFWNRTMCFNCWQRNKYVSDGTLYQKITVGPRNIVDVCKISNPCSSKEYCQTRKIKKISKIRYKDYEKVGKICFPKISEDSSNNFALICILLLFILLAIFIWWSCKKQMERY